MIQIPQALPQTKRIHPNIKTIEIAQMISLLLVGRGNIKVGRLIKMAFIKLLEPNFSRKQTQKKMQNRSHKSYWVKILSKSPPKQLNSPSYLLGSVCYSW